MDTGSLVISSIVILLGGGRDHFLEFAIHSMPSDRVWKNSAEIFGGKKWKNSLIVWKTL